MGLRNILFTAQLGLDHPIAIRYPRGRGVTVDWQLPFEEIAIGKAQCLKSGSKIAVLSTGTIGNNVIEAIDKIDHADHIAHYNFGFVKPLDIRLLHQIFSVFESVITIEDGVITGGFGSTIIEFALQNGYAVPVKTLGIPDKFIEHGSIVELQKICEIDVESIATLLKEK